MAKWIPYKKFILTWTDGRKNEELTFFSIYKLGSHNLKANAENTLRRRFPKSWEKKTITEIRHA